MTNRQPEAVLTYACRSDTGEVRSENQDSCGKYPVDNWDTQTRNGQLFIIADGMGGLRDGKLASELAVKMVSESYFEQSNHSGVEALQYGMEQANNEIYRRGSASAKKSSMGTTCTALLLKGSHATVAHIGDTRLYRISRNQIMQMTKDHSKVAEMERRGMITKEEAETHPERSQLYKALGLKSELEVDTIKRVTLTGEEFFVLSSDGLHGSVSAEEIKINVLQKSPDEACDSLVALARERGATDNITIQVVHLIRQSSILGRILRWPDRGKKIL
jgi:PPM family protein phosphatase